MTADSRIHPKYDQSHVGARYGCVAAVDEHQIEKLATFVIYKRCAAFCRNRGQISNGGGSVGKTLACVQPNMRPHKTTGYLCAKYMGILIPGQVGFLLTRELVKKADFAP